MSRPHATCSDPVCRLVVEDLARQVLDLQVERADWLGTSESYRALAQASLRELARVTAKLRRATVVIARLRDELRHGRLERAA